MVLIFLSWIYITFTTINLGFVTDKIFNLKKSNFVITSILGLFSTTLLASIFAVFYRINSEFHVFLLLINCLFFFKFKNEILNLYKQFISELKNLQFPLKIIASSITFLILAQCATKPYVIDNESYYIQSIKWINEFGFVKGLANLHIFFGQNSGWHIVQSAFNFSFLYENLNDLSGFCLLLGNLFAFLKLNEFFKNNDKNYLLIGLFPLGNLFFFQFISAPSPDIPVYVFTLILFYYFIKYYKNATIETFNLMTILVLFILYCKPTSTVLIVLPLVFLVLNFKKIAPKIVPISLLSFGVLLLFVIKNIVVSGFPLFPMTTFGFSNLDFAVPENVLTFYLNEIKATGFYINSSEFENSSTFQLLYKWLFSSKIDGIINIISITIFCISPLFIYRNFNKKSIWILYFTILLQMFLLFLSSPQYRFFIHLTLFLGLIMVLNLFSNKKIIFISNTISIVIIAFLLFTPINFNKLTSNKLLAKNNTFSIKNSIIPASNSKFENEYQLVKIGNLNYNSPINHSFFWGNGTGNLPCVNEKQINYFQNSFHVIPQLRSTELKDGFYAKKSPINE